MIPELCALFLCRIRTLSTYFYSVTKHPVGDFLTFSKYKIKFKPVNDLKEKYV